LLTSNSLINVTPTWGQLVSITRLREFELGICACRYPSADCMVGSHQQLTADIYTNCFEEMTCQFSSKPFLYTHIVSCATNMKRHPSIPKMGRTLYPGRRRPFLTLLLKHSSTDASRTTSSTNVCVCFLPRLFLFFRIAEYHSFVTVANRAHIDMTFLIRYEVRNRILNS
jgi:hypothetical protein